MMIKNLIQPLAITCLISCALTVQAKENLNNKSRDYNYFKAKAGLTQPIDLGGNSGLNAGYPTFLAGVSVGRQVMDQFFVEIEYTHLGKNTAKYSSPVLANSSTINWDTEADTFMFNLGVELTKNNTIRPYLKGGIGCSRNKAHDYIQTTHTSSSDRYPGTTTNDFAYQMGAGLSMPITPIISTDFEYMYVNRGEIKTQSLRIMTNKNGYVGEEPDSARTGKLKEHSITVGIKIKF